MPRRPRMDAPGLVHHVIVRGVAKRTIFLDRSDCEAFLDRFERVLCDTGTPCWAWCLMGNHAHFVLRTARVGIGSVMARVLTSYARYFNVRYGRVGHLFQERYRSRPAVDEVDVRVLIRYVHQNPRKHGVLAENQPLEAYEWSGHPAMLGLKPARRFHRVQEALSIFGDDPEAARQELSRWMCQSESGAGGSGDLLREVDSVSDVAGFVRRCAADLDIDAHALARGRRNRRLSAARAWIAYEGSRRGIPPGQLAAALGVSRTALWHARGRGEAMARGERADPLAPIATR